LLRRTAIGRWIIAALALCGLAAAVWPAEAQGPLERLLDRLRQPDPPAPAAPAPAPANPARVIAAPAPQVEKNEDAMRVLVVGDFQARGLADALEDRLAEDPDVVIVDRTNGSSGLVRDDFYDWPAVLPDLVEEIEPSFVVMMVGTNDRQEMRTGEGTFRLRSEAWDAAYRARVASLSETLAVFGSRAIWVGHPPMRQQSMSADMAFFNAIYDDAAEQYGFTFLDIWDGFADAEGRFTATGPDVDGQIRTLRADDGFSFTSAGREKLAFFVEDELPLESDGGFVLIPDAGGIEMTEDGVPRVVGPVLVLGEPQRGANGELVTEAAPIRPSTLLHRFLVRGEPLPPVAGRVDDFSWPPGAIDEAPVAEAEAEEGQAALAEEDDPAAVGL